MSRPAERVVAFYNKRGTAEQWIKEGKGAIKWTRLSCRTLLPLPGSPENRYDAPQIRCSSGGSQMKLARWWLI
jgi:hypothetical protein